MHIRQCSKSVVFFRPHPNTAQSAAGEVRLTVRQDTGATPRPYSANAQLGRSASASMPHLSRASSFQRSFRRSSSFAADAQVAVLGPGDSFGDEVCGLGAPEAISSNRWAVCGYCQVDRETDICDCVIDQRCCSTYRAGHGSKSVMEDSCLVNAVMLRTKHTFAQCLVLPLPVSYKAQSVLEKPAIP